MEEIKKIKLDVVHTHHPFIASTLAIQIADSLKIPLFWTNHTRYEEYFNHYLPSLSGLSHQALTIHLRSVAFKCQKVICPSKIAVKILNSYDIKNTHVIYNGIDTSNFIPKISSQSKNLHLIYVGRIEKEKNIHLLIEIATYLQKIVPDFILHIIGDGKEIGSITEKIRNLNLAENVTLTGSIPREKLINYYQSAHFFISPSNTEIMPLTFIEALSTGLPVFCLKSSGVDKFLSKSPTIIPLSANPKKFAEKIHALFNSPTLSELSTTARNLGLKFDISNTAQKLEQLYVST